MPGQRGRLAAQRHVFIYGLDDFHRQQLATIAGSQRLGFHQLLEHDEAIHPERFPVDEMLAKSERILDAFGPGADAVCTYWDFPTSALVPILRERRNLAGAGLDAVLRLEHKYWARLEQQAVVPGLIPAFDCVDPFADDPAASLQLDFPFWLKPIKAHSSYLGFRIHNRQAFRRAIDRIREGIHQFGEPFDEVMAKVRAPAPIDGIGGYHCIAEGIISAGRQCTLEGFVHHGQVQVYGVVDSIREGRHRSSFQRYQYPSRLPRRVQARMIDAARRVMAQTGYDNAPFNMEFFWHRDADTIALLEVNARCSKSHSPLFHMVDGASHLQVMVNLGLGDAPDFPHRQGGFPMAAKFMLRVFRPGQVTRVPDAADIARLKARFPEALLKAQVERGQDLSDLRFQDSYSYELAELFLGGRNRQDLLQRYGIACEMLGFEVDHSAAAA
ncbi:UNVERIFIED_CONTAM: ATP-grasp domain-containing protein [Spiribacter pallidus]